MMTLLARYFVRRPMMFWSLVVAILAGGVLAFVQMPKLEDPAVSAKQAMVIVQWPGATAHQLELEVAQPMEDVLRALPDVNKVMTTCGSGSATLTVEFKMTVLASDLEQHFDLLRRKVSDVAPTCRRGVTIRSWWTT